MTTLQELPEIGFRGYKLDFVLSGGAGRAWRGNAMLADNEIIEKVGHSGINIFFDADDFLESHYSGDPVVGVMQYKLPGTHLWTANEAPSNPDFPSVARARKAVIIYLFLKEKYQKWKKRLEDLYECPVELFLNKENLKDRLSNGDFIDQLKDNNDLETVKFVKDDAGLDFMTHEDSSKFSDWLMNLIEDRSYDYAVWDNFEDYRQDSSYIESIYGRQDFRDGARKEISPEFAEIHHSTLKDLSESLSKGVVLLLISEDQDFPDGKYIFFNSENRGMKLLSAKSSIQSGFGVGTGLVDGDNLVSPRYDLDSLGNTFLVKAGEGDTFVDRNRMLNKYISYKAGIAHLEDIPVDFRFLWREGKDAKVNNDWFMAYLHKKRRLMDIEKEKGVERKSMLESLLEDSVGYMDEEEVSNYVTDLDSETVTDLRTDISYGFDQLKKVSKK